ncbi:MAG: type II toxin-antitoxin system HipA family toxin [Pseudomonadota bacterium]
MADDVEVWLDWHSPRQIGVLRRTPGRGRERVSFQYADAWIGDPDAFPISPEFGLTAGAFVPPAGQDTLAPIGDSAPDRWGRTVMRRYEGRSARAEGRKAKVFQETDYMLGVNDETRLGALRYKTGGVFQAPQGIRVPALLALGDLLSAAQRVLRGEETDEDLQMLFAPGSSLGGARPKASVFDQYNRLSVAKFPKDDDDYSLERWEAIALDMAAAAGINTADHTLENVGSNKVMLSHRFDRDGKQRIPFISAMAMLDGKDGDKYSYIDLADVIASESAQPEKDWRELFRRVVLSIMINNTDDHMRNHGFLRTTGGWQLSPAYDINPVPNAPRVLSSYISEDNPDGSIALLKESAAGYMVEDAAVDEIIGEVASVVNRWPEFAHQRGATEREMRFLEPAFNTSTS